MGFLTGLGRMIAGKPVFQVGDDPAAGRDDQPPAENGGRKIIPEVEVRRVDCDRSGESMSVWLDFINTSSRTVFLDRIHILGQTRELDFEIAPGGLHKLEAYRGGLLANSSYSTADLDYRTADDRDYFQARYIVEFHFDHGHYYPEELRLQRPVRDV